MGKRKLLLMIRNMKPWVLVEVRMKKIPLIANFLIDFRHTAGTEDVNDIVMSAAAELMSRSNIPSAASGSGNFSTNNFFFSKRVFER